MAINKDDIHESFCHAFNISVNHFSICQTQTCVLPLASSVISDTSLHSFFFFSSLIMLNHILDRRLDISLVIRPRITHFREHESYGKSETFKKSQPLVLLNRSYKTINDSWKNNKQEDNIMFFYCKYVLLAKVQFRKFKLTPLCLSF